MGGGADSDTSSNHGGATRAELLSGQLRSSPGLVGCGSSSGSGAGSANVPPSEATVAELTAAELDQMALPSKGSALHRWGSCKPCAFIFQDGCKNGYDCQFCHLCQPGEKKRRKKERLAVRRERRETAEADGSEDHPLTEVA